MAQEGLDPFGQKFLKSLGGLFLLDQFRDAFLGVLTPFGAAQLNFGIIEEVAAPGATTSGIILEKLDLRAALGTFRGKDISGLPMPGVLAGTFGLFHG
jgi:hypothetical protein